MVFINRILREFKTLLEKSYSLDNLFSEFVSTDQKEFADNFYLNIKQVQEILAMGGLISYGK